MCSRWETVQWYLGPLKYLDSTISQPPYRSHLEPEFLRMSSMRFLFLDSFTLSSTELSHPMVLWTLDEALSASPEAALTAGFGCTDHLSDKQQPLRSRITTFNLRRETIAILYFSFSQANAMPGEGKNRWHGDPELKPTEPTCRYGINRKQRRETYFSVIGCAFLRVHSAGDWN